MQLQQNISLANISWFRCGGTADYFVEVTNKSELQEAVAFAHSKQLPLLFVGAGSNLVFADEGFRGMIVRPLNTAISHEEDGRFRVGAGVQNAKFYQFARDLEYDFSGFFTVPGSIGGAAAGNSGIPGCEMQDFLLSAELFDLEQADFVTVSLDFFDYVYRHSVFRDQPEIKKSFVIWEVTLQLPSASKTEIEAKAENILAMRKEKQPWGKTGGSFFRNPPEGAAGHFLEQVGAKQMRVGGAFFSEKHANFLMSDGTATQADIIELARQAMQKVREQFDVQLKPEVILLDEKGEEREL